MNREETGVQENTSRWRTRQSVIRPLRSGVIEGDSQKGAATGGPILGGRTELQKLGKGGPERAGTRDRLEGSSVGTAGVNARTKGGCALIHRSRGKEPSN